MANSLSSALTIPNVTVGSPFRPIAFPIATTQSPTRRLLLLDIYNGVKPDISTLITAKSVRGSWPINSASASVSS